MSTMKHSPDAIYRRLLEKYSDAAIIVRDGKLVFVNDAFARLVGASVGDLDNRELKDVFEPGDIELLRTYDQPETDEKQGSNEIQVRLKRGGGGAGIQAVLRAQKFAGDIIAAWIKGAVEPRLGETGDGVLEDRMRQAQKMEAIGTLAGGVAHDMNNILSTIMSLASVLRQELEPDDPKIEDLDDILSATRRGRDLTNNLLGFARKGQYRKEYISLNHVVHQVRELLTRTIPKNIVWELDLDEAVPPVQGDFGQLSHALMNICLNAADAMKGGGALKISTGRLQVRKENSETRLDLKDGEYSLLRVTDTGAGMDPEILDRVFEPFFSTKEKDRGTGLGLAMVWGTVRNHGGAVTIDSLPGKGATVSIYLPAAGKNTLDKRTSPNLQPVKSIGSGKVLVVDDEELILRSAKRALETLGYSTLLAANGKDAIEVFERHKDELILVILDLTMPVMDGETTFHKLRAIDNRIPILLSSGHTREGKAEELLQAGAAAFVQKPFDVYKLFESILAATQH
jgi:two-component system cell cycle sensor histidine kinase/response regulator CckA